MAKQEKSAAEAAATKVVTGEVRFSYLHAFEPTSMPGETDPNKKKYSVSLIIPKKSPDVARIKAAIKAATDQGLTSKFGGKVPANFKQPLRDGDKERPEDEAYANSYFLSASSKTKPGIVDVNAQPILDSTELYSGCYGRASLNFYPFNSNGSKGVACGLNHLQKIKDGEALGGRGNAADDFGTYESSETEEEDLL